MTDIGPGLLLVSDVLLLSVVACLIGRALVWSVRQVGRGRPSVHREAGRAREAVGVLAAMVGLTLVAMAALSLSTRA